MVVSRKQAEEDFSEIDRRKGAGHSDELYGLFYSLLAYNRISNAPLSTFYAMDMHFGQKVRSFQGRKTEKKNPERNGRLLNAM